MRLRALLAFVCFTMISTSSFAEELRRPTRQTLCKYLVTNTFNLSGRKAASLTKKCMSGIKTKVVEGSKYTDVKYDILTKMKATFDLDEGKYKAKGNTTLLNKLQTLNTGRISNKWTTPSVNFDAVDGGIEREFLAYEAALEKVEDAGSVKDQLAVLKKIKAVKAKYDNWKDADFDDIFPDYSSPEEMPDYELTDEVTYYWYKSKSGELWPLAAYIYSSGTYEGNRDPEEFEVEVLFTANEEGVENALLD